MNSTLTFYFILFCLFQHGVQGQTNKFIRVSLHNPRYFEYSDGEPFIPIGPNICWERFEKDETKILELYGQRFKNLAENGGNYTRIWLSAPFFEIEHVKANEYDHAIIKRIDCVLALAEQHGIKVKFCFENFRKLEDYPAKFPGSVPFDKPIYSKTNGGPLSTIDDYFKTPEGRRLFINKMNFLADHYSRNHAVFGWELWNEINSVRVSDMPGSVLKWTKDMLPVLKTAFPNHLVMQSLGSYDKESSYSLYDQFMKIPSNEVAQVHRYIDPGATWKICQAPMDVLASHAVRDLRRMVKDKPVVLSEVGAVEAHHSGPSLLYETDTMGILLHDLLFAPFFSGAAAPGQSWHWQFYIEKNNLWWHFNRFAKAIEGINPVKEDYQPFYTEYDNVRIYGLKGKTNNLIWCRDARCNWETELVEHKRPVERSLSLPTSVIRNEDQTARIRLYDPWADSWTMISAVNEVVTVPRFRRSFMIRIDHQ